MNTLPWKETLRQALPRDQADTFVDEFEALPVPFSGQRFIEEITAGDDPEAVLQRAMMVHNYVRQHGWPASYAIVEAGTTKNGNATHAQAEPKVEVKPPTAEEQEAARVRIRYEKRLAEISQLASAVPPSSISRLPQEERAAMKDSVERIRDWANRLWTVIERDDS